MRRTLKRVHLDNDADIAEAIRGLQADKAPRVLERAGEEIAVVLTPADYAALDGTEKPDIWANYDPERARAALRALQGGMDNIDIEQFKRDIRAQRGQDSRGRPAD